MTARKSQRFVSRHASERRLNRISARIVAVGSLLTVTVVAIAIVLTFTRGPASARPSGTHPKRSAKKSSAPHKASLPGTASVPILAYEVIDAAPAQTALSPSLYVPAGQFLSQMQALSAAGWHATTLDQLEAYWTHGTSLGTSKPIVITFDGGYASQYAKALPILKRLGWTAVENLPLNGLPASEGGLSDTQVRDLIAAGWELDTQGTGAPDLTAISGPVLSDELSSARQTLQTRYAAPVNWLSYPSGSCNATVVAAARSAGFTGASTLATGWASPHENRYSLPRLQVLAGTSPSSLLAEIASAQAANSTPGASQCA